MKIEDFRPGDRVGFAVVFTTIPETNEVILTAGNGECESDSPEKLKQNSRQPWVVADPMICTKILAAVQAEPKSFDMTAWHSIITDEHDRDCGTTHCLGGWAVELAPCGRDLEAKLGEETGLAALQILIASGVTEVPDFYATEDQALAWLKRQSERELQQQDGGKA